MTESNEFLAEEQKSEPESSESEAQEKIKVGEAEYTQDELNKFVNLGKTAAEYEEKWDRKIDTIYPKYVEATQKLSDIEKQQQEKEQEPEPQVEPGSEEEIRQQALKKAQELGIVTKEDVNNFIDARLEAKELKEDVRTLLDEIKDDGRPGVEEQELLNYMADNGLRNPTTAYKVMKEAELDEWKEKKVSSMKPEGFKTQSSSTAGETKRPVPKVAQTPDELREQLRSYMKQTEGSENA